MRIDLFHNLPLVPLFFGEGEGREYNNSNNERGLIISFFFLLIFLASCQQKQRLPVYGNKQLVPVEVNGNVMADSADYTLPPFSLTDQNGNTVTEKTTAGKVHVADFFFTSCPSICPKMKAEMYRVYEKYLTNPQVMILSYTIDPARDSVGKLKDYEAKLGITADRWKLLTGEKDSIYRIAESYLVNAAEDPDAPGGHVHSGNFILVDKQRRIRGYYDGTNPESVNKLLVELDILLNEK